MKQVRKYRQGELIDLKKKLSSEDKKILNEFLDKCRINAGESKVEKIERFLLMFSDITGKPLTKQDKKSVTAFLIVFNKSDYSFWTKNEAKGYIKKFLMWYYKDLELIEDFRRTPKEDKISENDLLTEEELERMLKSAESFRQKALLFLAYESGCRPQEIKDLKWKDIRFHNDYGEISVFCNKTKKMREYPIKHSCIHLKRWKQEFIYPNPKGEDYVFPNPTDRSKNITTTAILKTLKRIGKRAEIEKNIKTYLFRHTRATRLYERLPVPLVEKLLGHKGMYPVYAHISNKKAKEEMLEKVYNVEELSETDKKELEKIQEKMKQMIESQKWLVEMQQKLMNKAKIKNVKMKVPIPEFIENLTA